VKQRETGEQGNKGNISQFTQKKKEQEASLELQVA